VFLVKNTKQGLFFGGLNGLGQVAAKILRKPQKLDQYGCKTALRHAFFKRGVCVYIAT
jgi:hypothetical protein